MVTKKKYKKLKKPRITSLKAKAWVVFSQYIRQKYADWQGYAACVTCQRIYYWKALHAGHFIAGRGNAILFEENGVHPQCYVCNVRKHGDQLNYYRFMVRTYGEDEVARLELLSKQSRKFTAEDLNKIIAKYTP